MPPWRELRSRRVAVVAVAAALAVAVLTGAGVAAWQHRTLAFASPLTNTADLAASAGQQVDDQAQLASILTPVATYTVSARFGQRGAHWHTRHTGFDFVAPWGTPVRAIQEATVLKLAWNGAYGRMIILRLAPGVTAWYCHLSSVSVTEGEIGRAHV